MQTCTGFVSCICPGQKSKSQQSRYALVLGRVMTIPYIKVQYKTHTFPFSFHKYFHATPILFLYHRQPIGYSVYCKPKLFKTCMASDKTRSISRAALYTLSNQFFFFYTESDPRPIQSITCDVRECVCLFFTLAGTRNWVDWRLLIEECIVKMAIIRNHFH